jgi:uncharacterized membrane protein
MPRWLAYSIFAVGIFGVWGIVSTVAIKRDLSALTIQVLSTLGLVPAALPLLFSPSLRKGQRFARGIAAAFSAGLCGSLGNVALFQSLNEGGQASAVYPLTGMYPLVTVALAPILLRERFNCVQGAGILLALIALYLFGLASADAPQGTPVSAAPLVAPWMLFALAALVLWGMVGFLQKVATSYISDALSTLCFAAAFVPVAAVILAVDPIEWKMPFSSAALAVLVGVLLVAGTFLLFAAYRTGKASIVTPISALYPAVTVVLAVPIFDEALDLDKLAAIVLALAAAVALSYEGRAQPAEATSAR